MNKKALMLLLLLKSNNADSSLRSMSISELMQLEDIPQMQSNTLYKMLRILINAGLVAMGIPDGKASTFYITKQGLSKIGELNEQ